MKRPTTTMTFGAVRMWGATGAVMAALTALRLAAKADAPWWLMLDLGSVAVWCWIAWRFAFLRTVTIECKKIRVLWNGQEVPPPQTSGREG
jgi:hypothetical protein